MSLGAQVSGKHWHRPDDVLAMVMVNEGLSSTHRDYLAAGGCGFVLCDGRLNYGREQIVEIYYRAQLTAGFGRYPVRVQISPDVQYIRNPGYNRDRGPVTFWGVRLHLEY